MSNAHHPNVFNPDIVLYPLPSEETCSTIISSAEPLVPIKKFFHASSAEEFISTIYTHLYSLKSPESNRWAPLIKGEDAAGIALRHILAIAFQLSCNCNSTAAFFKKGVGGKRNHSTAIFNLVKSLIDRTEINTEQLNVLATCLIPLEKIWFPPAPGSQRSTSTYLYSKDYEALVQLIENRKTLPFPRPDSISVSPVTGQSAQAAHLITPCFIPVNPLHMIAYMIPYAFSPTPFPQGASTLEADIHQSGVKRKAEADLPSALPEPVSSQPKPHEEVGFAKIAEKTLDKTPLIPTKKARRHESQDVFFEDKHYVEILKVLPREEALPLNINPASPTSVLPSSQNRYSLLRNLSSRAILDTEQQQKPITSIFTILEINPTGEPPEKPSTPLNPAPGNLSS